MIFVFWTCAAELASLIPIFGEGRNMTLLTHSDRARSTRCQLRVSVNSKYKVQLLVQLALFFHMETTKYFMVSPSKKMRECFDTVLEVGVSQEKKKQRRLEEQRVAGRGVEWQASRASCPAKFHHSVVEGTYQSKNKNYSILVFERTRSIQDGNRKDQLAELPLRRL